MPPTIWVSDVLLPAAINFKRINRVTAKKCRAIHAYMDSPAPVRLAMVQRPLALP